MIKRTMSLAITPDTVEEENVSCETFKPVKEEPKPKKKTTKRRKKNEDK